MAKKPKEAPTKSGNRRLNDSEMKAQRQQSAERKEREAARLKAQKTVNPNAPRNRPNHRASSEKQAPKKSKWLSPFRRTTDAKKREQRRQKNSIAPLVRDLLSGEFLTREGVTRHIPYLLFISGMGYQFENMERAKIQNKRQLQELSAEYKTIKAQFETQLQQSRVEESIANIGLSQPVEPPYLLEQNEQTP